MFRGLCALILLVGWVDVARSKGRFKFDCRKLLASYDKASELYGGAVPRLFSSPPDFAKVDEGDPTLVVPFEIDNVKDGEGELQCSRRGYLNTMRFSYRFGAGDVSVERATLVMRAVLAAIANGDTLWADRRFEQLSTEAFKSLKMKQIRGDAQTLFGKADVDFEPHYAGRLVVTPERVTLSIATY